MANEAIKKEHDLYKDGDANIPEAILDRNGQVDLDCCKICKKAEVELTSDNCLPGTKNHPLEIPGTIEEVAERVRSGKWTLLDLQALSDHILSLGLPKKDFLRKEYKPGERQATNLPEMSPCPFCASKDLKIIDIKSEDDGRPYAKAVFCSSCHTTGRHNHPIGWAESNLEAIESWNNRVGLWVASLDEVPTLSVEGHEVADPSSPEEIVAMWETLTRLFLEQRKYARKLADALQQHLPVSWNSGVFGEHKKLIEEYRAIKL